MPRTVLTTVIALLVLAAPASALPGDPPAVPLRPVGGAAVAANPDGVALTFTCPAYRDSPSDDGPSDDLNGYSVALSRDAAFAGNPIAFSSDVVRSPADAAQCTTVIQDRSSSLPAQITPGTYYWRVTRTCFCGDSSDETGPTGSFTITAPASKLTAGAQAKAYAGYPIRVTLATDLPDGQPVALQRLDGKTWKTVKGPDKVASRGAAAAVVTLTAGRRRLRWIAVRGSQTDAGDPVTVTVVKARRWSTDKRDDGAYAGNRKFLTEFEVAGRGRELRRFRAAVTVYCVGSFDDVTKNYFRVSFAAVKRIRVAPDGRFLAVADISKSHIVVSGRLRNGRVTQGRLSLAYPLCAGGRTFTAKR